MHILGDGKVRVEMQEKESGSTIWRRVVFLSLL